MAESAHNQQSDDEPRSLVAPDFSREQQTGINSSTDNQLDDSGIDLNQTNVSGDHSEGIPTLDGTSPAQTLDTQNVQDLINHYSQLKKISCMSSDAEDTIKRYLQGGASNTDIVNALQMGIKMFEETVVLKRNSEDLLARFQSCSPALVVEDTGSFNTTGTEMQTQLVTTLTPSQSHQLQDVHVPAAISTHDLLNATTPAPTNHEETVPVYDVNEHIPDTLRWTGMAIIDSDDEDMYEVEPCFGATSAALPDPTAKEDTLETSIQRILADHRENRRIEADLADHLLPLSKCVGTVMTEYHPPEATITGGVNQTKTHIYGTCFRLGSKYVLTNKHVVDMANLTDCKIAFNRYPPGPVQFPIEQIKFTCRDPNLDYSVLELTIPSHQFQAVQENLPGLGHLVQKLGKGQKVTLIGHPNGDPMSMDPSCPVVSPLKWYKFIMDDISKSEAFLLRHPERALYRSTFGQGSSGSPVFDDKGYLVGMHTCGFPTNGPSQVEQMIRMTAIRAEVRLHQPDLCADLFPSPIYQPP